MADAVYVLCALTAFGCAALLARGYLRTKARLLLWSTLCFVALAANNMLLVLERVFFPTLDLYRVRLISAVVALMLLVYGLIWDVER